MKPHRKESHLSKPHSEPQKTKWCAWMEGYSFTVDGKDYKILRHGERFIENDFNHTIIFCNSDGKRFEMTEKEFFEKVKLKK